MNLLQMDQKWSKINFRMFNRYVVLYFYILFAHSLIIQALQCYNAIFGM